MCCSRIMLSCCCSIITSRLKYWNFNVINFFYLRIWFISGQKTIWQNWHVKLSKYEVDIKIDFDRQVQIMLWLITPLFFYKLMNTLFIIYAYWFVSFLDIRTHKDVWKKMIYWNVLWMTLTVMIKHEL
jgi:hypothetical protein